MRYNLSLGIFSLFPHYYLVAFTPQKSNFCFLWQKKVLHAETLYLPRAYRSLSIPWRFCELSKVNQRPSHEQHYCYHGQNQGEEEWMLLLADKHHVQKYLCNQGPLAQHIDCFELDILALWTYAYWLLFSIKGFDQSILWIYEHQDGQYFLYGRNEHLWSTGTTFKTCLQGWPSPKRIVSFNQNLSFEMANVECLQHSHFAWVMATALAIRGGYDLI